MTDTSSAYEGWTILEVMGHRRLGGWVTEVTIAGASFLRIDVPEGDGQPAMTQMYAPSSIYALTPTTEEIARRAAALFRPAPVTRWELAAIPAAGAVADRPHDDEDDEDDEDGPF